MNTTSLNQLLDLALSDYIDTIQSRETFPLACEFVDNTFGISKQCKVLISTNNFKNHNTTKTPSTIELVVFSTLTFKQLHNIVEQCKIKLESLSAINHRNGQISFRFTVQCAEYKQARAQLATIALNETFEAALIESAPTLSNPGLLVMDMDSTTIEIECIDEIAKLAGVGEQVSTVTELAMQGKLDFSQSLYQRVATLKDSPDSILEEVAKNIPLMKGLENLISELKKYQWKIAIASGGFTYFAEHLKLLLNLDAVHANELEILNNKLTGRVLGDIVDAQAKADYLLHLQELYALPTLQTVAMGDGANDLVMMSAAHFGIAFHAKPIVLKQADCAINFSGLDCLLHWLK